MKNIILLIVAMFAFGNIALANTNINKLPIEKTQGKKILYQPCITVIKVFIQTSDNAQVVSDTQTIINPECVKNWASML